MSSNVSTERFSDPGAISVISKGRLHKLDIEDEFAIDPDVCRQAICSRDPRFDGRFFTGATTTGIYCRNVCPVPSAKPTNLVLFACSNAAESAGFRACRRCRPHATPGTPAWNGTSAVVNRAFRLILQGALDEGNVEELAERMGLGSRHLRRLFMQHLGAAPLKIANACRINRATKLIFESKLPITQIAFRSGFKSVREFNHAVRLATGRCPTELRQATVRPRSLCRSGSLELRLPYRQPFDWECLITFLMKKAIPGVEHVTRMSYRRTIESAGVVGVLTVKMDAAANRLVVRLETDSYEGLEQTVERIRRMFDLGADPIQIASHLSRDPRLRELLKLHPGLRVPGVWDGFEAAVQAILGQSLTRSGSKKTIARLVKAFGTPLNSPVHGLQYLFPRPEVLAVADLSKAGICANSSRILRVLARSTVRNNLSFRTCRSLGLEVAQLTKVCKVDESTASYIAMRAFGESDALPADENWLRRRLLVLSKPARPVFRSVDIVDRWRPWRAYAAMYLWAAGQGSLGKFY